jgi:hypothetical protein
MPSSYADSFPGIVHMLIRANPKRVIDIGPGWGKYGLACREYLPELESLRAVEVAPGRLPTQDAIYDMVYTDDVRDLIAIPDFWTRFDLAILVDVIEHLDKNEGHALLAALQEAGVQTLVSTPKIFFEQHDDNNPFEEHVSLWTWGDFDAYGIQDDASTIDATIYLLLKRTP